jgi:hypothetical protein
VRTGFGGRNGRGKMFLPPPGETEVTASSMDNPTLTLLTAFLNCMAGKFLGSSPSTVWRMGVLSRKLAGPTNGTFDQGFFIASQLSPVARLAVISRRKIGHGR